ncbi:MAG: hypothetical protein COA96_02265 [SAR86 cluster bacterium]|uniref:Uncharacterized protein n=1 Tax=SAR86 cluster bacterium TaxID=2030880 RepID=A0A2A5B8W2_9GAMM|nr:MAG: hypothetical protein COA96_02265 [SAR86 cluster bacterium]
MVKLGRCIVFLACMSITAQAAAQSPGDLKGTLIVLNKNGHNASFIDLGSGEMLATLPTGQGPHELIVTDDGRWAIGTDYAGGNSLTVFDVENLEVEKTINLDKYPRPHGILFLPGQEEVIVTSELSSSLVIVNFRTGEVVRTIDTNQNGSHMVAVSEDGRVAYTSNGNSNSVSVIDIPGGQFIKAIDVPKRPEAISTNKSGSEIWVGSNDESVVSIISPQDESVIAQWSGFEWPYRILLTDDERYAIMPDLGNGKLRFFDVVSRTELGSIDLRQASPQGVTLYSDDRTLFLSLSAENKVLVIDIESREVLGEYLTGEAPDGIAYSPLVLRKTIVYQ